MMETPKRSVTRFFIPLVDVMILLFSMFMLMPIVEQAGSGEGDGSGGKSATELAQDNEALQRELQRRMRELQQLESISRSQVDVLKLQQELEKLKKEKVETLEKRLVIRPLEIDADNGNLFYYAGSGKSPPRRLIDSEEVARDLIKSDREKAAPRDVFYLVRLPVTNPFYPTPPQLRDYRRWFADVPIDFKSPAAPFKR